MKVRIKDRYDNIYEVDDNFITFISAVDGSRHSHIRMDILYSSSKTENSKEIQKIKL